MQEKMIAPLKQKQKTEDDSEGSLDDFIVHSNEESDESGFYTASSSDLSQWFRLDNNKLREPTHKFFFFFLI